MYIYAVHISFCRGRPRDREVAAILAGERVVRRKNIAAKNRFPQVTFLLSSVA